jgi:hypothetical protein
VAVNPLFFWADLPVNITHHLWFATFLKKTKPDFSTLVNAERNIKKMSIFYDT